MVFYISSSHSFSVPVCWSWSTYAQVRVYAFELLHIYSSVLVLKCVGIGVKIICVWMWDCTCVPVYFGVCGSLAHTWARLLRFTCLGQGHLDGWEAGELLAFPAGFKHLLKHCQWKDTVIASLCNVQSLCLLNKFIISALPYFFSFCLKAVLTSCPSREGWLWGPLAWGNGNPTLIMMAIKWE